MSCLDGRALHFGAGKCCLGTGLGKMLKAVKPAPATAHLGWMQLGNTIDFTHRSLRAPRVLKSEAYDNTRASESCQQLLKTVMMFQCTVKAGHKRREVGK